MSSSSIHDDENKMTSSSESDAHAPSIQTQLTNVASASASAASTTTPLHTIDDDTDGPPLPIGMAENISIVAEPPKQIGKVEIVEDNHGPALPPAMMGDVFDDSHTKMAAASAGRDLGCVNGVGPPTPFNIAQFDDDGDAIAKKLAREDMDRKPAAVEVPARQDIDEFDVIQPGSINRGDGSDNRRGWGDIESRGRRGIESQTLQGDNTGNNTSCDHSFQSAAANITPADIQVEAVEDDDQVDIHIPEAFLVEEEDGEVFIATPTLPWWKQRRTKIFASVVFILLAAMAIALGVLLSQPEPDPLSVVTEVFALATLSPSSFPSSSLVPSSSLAPSSSPTECVNKIISNKQRIDLPKDLQIDDPRGSEVAVDGRNMVAVAGDGKYYMEDEWGYESYKGPVFITFYLLEDKEWQRVQTPLRLENMGHSYQVAISGTTAFIAFWRANKSAGIVLVYEQNQFGGWERMEDDPFTHATSTNNTTRHVFGRSVEIDGDLACIGSYAYDDDVYVDNQLHLYHREDNNKWVEFYTFDDSGHECSISGYVIAVTLHYLLQLYKYNADENEIVLIQDPIATGYVGTMDLSNDYLAYWEKDEENTFIYKRDETNQTFTLHQQLNITGPQHWLALDNDILVVSVFMDRDDIVFSFTTFFSLQNDVWVETIILDQAYAHFQLSGRNLIAADDGIEVDLLANGKIHDAAAFWGRQTIETSVAGEICDCGLGMSPCECQDKVCLIEHDGVTLFYEKISNCANGGGLAAIIYNHVDKSPQSLSLPGGYHQDIPAVFINQMDGQYILGNDIGKLVEMTLSRGRVHAFNIQTCTQDMPTQIPSMSLSPTTSPSSSPSGSFSPTSCGQKISSNLQKIDPQIDVSQPPGVAVDGSHMVVVGQDIEKDGRMLVTFYSLDNNNKWQHFNSSFSLDDMGYFASASLSGSTAMIGFPEAGIVLVYEWDQFGGWVKLEDPFIHLSSVDSLNLGYAIDVDGDLACLQGGERNGVYIYHRDGNKWMQIDKVDTGNIDGFCSISGDIIAVERTDSELQPVVQIYHYSQELNEVVSLPDPIRPGNVTWMGWSNGLLALQHYWGPGSDGSDVFIYEQNETSKAFIKSRDLSINGYVPLSLNDDILVFSGYNDGGILGTHIFSVYSEEEIITLDEEYSDYQLSGMRNLVATKINDTPAKTEVEIHSFNIHDPCV